MDKKISIHLSSGFDSSGVRQASKSLSDFHAKLIDSNKTLLQINAEMSERMHRLAENIAVDFGAAADKSVKGMGRIYETIDQINARIDAPKRMAREQEALNRELRRYCELCEEAQRREQARMNSYRSPKSQWNQGPGAGTLYKNPNAAGGTAEAGLNIGKMRSVIPALMAIDRMSGNLDGNLGKVTRGMQGVIGLSAAFGPAGAAVGLGFAAMQFAADQYIESQEEVVKKLEEMYAAMRKHSKAIMDSNFRKTADDVRSVADAAENAAAYLEKTLQRQAASAKIRVGMDAAIGRTELLKMHHDMAADVDESDDANKGRVAAAWRLKIAEKEAEIRERAAKIEADNAQDAMTSAQKRADLAEKNLKSLAAAEERASSEYKRVRDAFAAHDGRSEAEQNPEVVRYKELAEAAKTAARDAAKEYDNSLDALKELDERSKVEARDRENSIAQARDAVEAASREYDREERNYELASVRIAAAEREKLDREAHQKRMADLRAEIAASKEAASPFEAVAAAAKTEFDRAFAMYRDPERARAEIDEERDRSDDLKRLHKDASRYGGKWRIDELAELMSVGDTEGVNSRLEEWRKRKSFTPEVEAMVRASAAEQTQTTAEDELRKIEGNTRNLSDKLDQLLTMKGN